MTLLKSGDNVGITWGYNANIFIIIKKNPALILGFCYSMERSQILNFRVFHCDSIITMVATFSLEEFFQDLNGSYNRVNNLSLKCHVTKCLPSVFVMTWQRFGLNSSRNLFCRLLVYQQPGKQPFFVRCFVTKFHPVFSWLPCDHLRLYHITSCIFLLLFFHIEIFKVLLIYKNRICDITLNCEKHDF